MPQMRASESQRTTNFEVANGPDLNRRELRPAGPGLLRLVFVALPLKRLIGTLVGHWMAGLSWRVAIPVCAILVVIGSTVIMPLLGQTWVEPRAATFLRCGAIVNDPIGAALTLLMPSYGKEGPEDCSDPPVG